ncbi:GlsB/YeaQ/YmgE family stress response membrane protein [Arthrobacter alpinus]|nr:GlsB/YeaQ/YmgE family stress response membrane protein [Arthrobacter alpinus]
MGFIGWIVLGLIVGVIVSAVMPGKDGEGWITSLGLGVLGGFLGGCIDDLLFGDGKVGFGNLGSWFLTIVGGLIVAGTYGAVTGRPKTTA